MIGKRNKNLDFFNKWILGLRKKRIDKQFHVNQKKARKKIRILLLNWLLMQLVISYFLSWSFDPEPETYQKWMTEWKNGRPFTWDHHHHHHHHHRSFIVNFGMDDVHVLFFTFEKNATMHERRKRCRSEWSNRFVICCIYVWIDEL